MKEEEDDDRSMTTIGLIGSGSIGFDTVDAGPLAENWRTQRDTPAYVAPYGAYQESGPLPGTPASAQVVREALAAAKPTAS
jgi:8-hydroxy-5-deazaflavin:NADPH oxidoreductase